MSPKLFIRFSLHIFVFIGSAAGILNLIFTYLFSMEQYNWSFRWWPYINNFAIFTYF
jgi:hypothetical protein